MPQEDGGIIFDTCDVYFPDACMPCFEFVGEEKYALKSHLQTFTNDPASTEEPMLLFPGPQPMSIDSGHFSSIRGRQFCVAPKTDGVRACVMFTRYRGADICCAFDRTLQRVFGIRVHKAPSAMFQGTILDCEIVVNQNTQEFHILIFDAFILCGQPLFHKPFSTRLGSVHTCLDMCGYHFTYGDSGILEVKQFTMVKAGMYQPSDSRFFNDGYIFMPEQEPIVFGRSESVFKLKTCHSVDFLYKSGILNIFNTKTRRYVKAGVVEEENPSCEGQIVECVLVKNNATSSRRVWRVLKIRADKTKSNSLFVMEKTILNIEENLSFSDIVNVINSKM